MSGTEDEQGDGRRGREKIEGKNRVDSDVKPTGRRKCEVCKQARHGRADSGGNCTQAPPAVTDTGIPMAEYLRGFTDESS